MSMKRTCATSSRICSLTSAGTLRIYLKTEQLITLLPVETKGGSVGHYPQRLVNFLDQNYLIPLYRERAAFLCGPLAWWEGVVISDGKQSFFERLSCDSAQLTPFFPDAVIQCVRSRQAARSVCIPTTPASVVSGNRGFVERRE